MTPVDLGNITTNSPFTAITNLATAQSQGGGLISTIISTFTIVSGLAFFFYFLMASFKWLTAGGDKGKISEATNQIVQSIVGLVIVIVAYFVIGIVGSILGINILNPFGTIDKLAP